MISPWRPMILRANTVVQTLVTLLTTGFDDHVRASARPDMNSWK